MRIYAFTEHFPNLYKPYLDTQFADLVEQGHELRIFAFGKFDAPLPARTRALAERTRYLPLTLRSLPRAAPRALALVNPGSLRAWDGTHRAKQNLLDTARAALLPREAPDLCLIHNLVTAQYLGFLGKLYPRARLALYFHGGEVPNAGTITAADTRAAFERVHRVFTNTRFSRDQAIARGCPPEKIVVCPVGFHLEQYEPSPRTYRPQGVLRLLSVGRVSSEKGFHVALQAVRLLLERGHGGAFDYRIVGRGPDLPLLEAEIAQFELGDHVELAGERPSDALAGEYRSADVLLLPSLRTPSWEETQACVVQEAMLMKLPVVATRTGGVLESLASELHPFTVEPGDEAALAGRIEALLALTPAELSRLGEAGRAFAAARYDIRRLDQMLLDEAMRSGAGAALRIA